MSLISTAKSSRCSMISVPAAVTVLAVFLSDLKIFGLHVLSIKIRLLHSVEFFYHYIFNFLLTLRNSGLIANGWVLRSLLRLFPSSFGSTYRLQRHLVRFSSLMDIFQYTLNRTIVVKEPQGATYRNHFNLVTDNARNKNRIQGLKPPKSLGT